MNSEYFHNLEILLRKNTNQISGLESTDCVVIGTCRVSIFGNFLIINKLNQLNENCEEIYSVYNLDEIKTFRDTWTIKTENK